MKWLHLIFVFSIYSELSGQMCPCEFGKDKNAKTRRNEILLSGFNVHEDLINFYSENILYVFAPVSGITYKRHFNNFSLRTAYSYAQHDYHFRLDNASDYNRNDGYGFNHDIRLGIEKTFSASKLQYFAGVDLVYNRGIYNGLSEGFGDFKPYYKTSYRFTTNSLGLSPLVGVKWRFSKLLSASMESSLQMVHYASEGSVEYNKEKGIALMVQPIRSLGLSVNF